MFKLILTDYIIFRIVLFCLIFCVSIQEISAQVSSATIKVNRVTVIFDDKLVNQVPYPDTFNIKVNGKWCITRQGNRDGWTLNAGVNGNEKKVVLTIRGGVDHDDVVVLQYKPPGGGRQDNCLGWDLAGAYLTWATTNATECTNTNNHSHDGRTCHAKGNDHHVAGFTETLTNITPAPSCPSDATGTHPNCVCPTGKGWHRSSNTCRFKVSVNDVSTDEGAGSTRFTVSVPPETTGAWGVDYTTRNGTAKAGSDYRAASGRVAVNSGQFSQNPLVQIIDDEIHESDETFKLVLSNPTDNVMIVDGEGIATIRDDDDPPISTDPTPPPSDPDPPECPQGQHNHNNFGCHSLTEDHHPPPPNTQPPSNENPNPPPPPPQQPDPQDGEDEEEEEPEPEQPEPEQPTLPSLSVRGMQANEKAEIATFELSLDKASDTDTTVQYETADLSAKAGEDYESSQGNLTIPAGDLTATINVVLIDDELYEYRESFYLDITHSENVTKGRRTGVTIVSNDPQPKLSIADSEATEGGFIQVVITLDKPSGIEARANWRYEDRTATAGTDYYRKSLTGVFEPGVVLYRNTLRIFDDSEEEDTETFVVNIYSAQGARIDRATGTMTILDNDTESEDPVAPDDQVDEDDREMTSPRTQRSWKHIVRRMNND